MKIIDSKSPIRKTDNDSTKLDIIFNSSLFGVIEFDKNRRVTYLNKEAMRILEKDVFESLESHGCKLIKNISFNSVFLGGKSIDNQNINVNSKDCYLSIFPILKEDKVDGAFAMIREIRSKDNKRNKVSKRNGKSHHAKYTFHDIIGNSEDIKHCISVAKRMADSDSSILIHGETGTGKELFAQAIHNESQRRNSPFVAVNCGAFHENILESELFGYEEGAFTGARKGGKIGFFELAHNGTIFLDEISEMSKNLQVKILRVLQEKEIMKLGSDKVIDVNIRVIAASNKNLKDLMKKNDFRKDLYYRLNILPLEIPPLRSRPEDIEELIIRFKRKFGSDFSIDSDCMSLLFQHKWDGNVRELRNIVEYLTNLGKKRINLDDIPLMDKRNNGKIENTIENERIIDPTILDNKHTSKYMFVLKTLYESRINRKRIGRRGILNVALENNFFISEKEIRNIIEKLESNSFVLVEKGRAGTSLTESGISLFQKLYKS